MPRVLIVDDNVDITQMLSTYLKVKDIDCTIVNDGKGGLDLMRKDKFDTVFLDMSMPDFSGLDVIDALEKEDILKNQRIIIFTASSISNDAIDELLTKDGVERCLRKPAVLSEVLEVINSP